MRLLLLPKPRTVINLPRPHSVLTYRADPIMISHADGPSSQRDRGSAAPVVPNPSRSRASRSRLRWGCRCVRAHPITKTDTFRLRLPLRLGGKSTVHVDLGPEGKGRFWGKLSNELNPGRRRDGVLEKGGYAGFRNKVRPCVRFAVCSKEHLANISPLGMPMCLCAAVSDNSVWDAHLGHFAARVLVLESAEFGRRDAVLCQHPDGRPE